MNNNKKDKMDIYEKLFKILVVIVCAIFYLYISHYIPEKNIKISILIFILCILLLFFTYQYIMALHMNDICTKLSKMMDYLIKLEDNEVFNDSEDTILSKLQMQALKLLNIYKMQNSNLKLERNKLKSLISDISHQLKTPLSTVKMYSELLFSEDLDDDERDYYKKAVIFSLDRLTFLIESIVKLSRLEGNIIKMNITKCSLNDTILTAINEVRVKAEKKHINIKYKENSKIEIFHDQKWTSEAIFNVIENAVKYTDEYGIINIFIENNDLYSRIDIKDNGNGISKEDIPKIFKRFYRGKNASSIEGVGIGLYLTRKIIVLEDGYIKVKSTKDGSIFSIFLPNKNDLSN